MMRLEVFSYHEDVRSDKLERYFSSIYIQKESFL